MSLETKIDALSEQLSNLSLKVDFLVSEKSLNEDPDYVRAMAEAKKGNTKALREYTKRRARVNVL
jgi:hypothetical protein